MSQIGQLREYLHFQRNILTLPQCPQDFTQCFPFSRVLNDPWRYCGWLCQSELPDARADVVATSAIPENINIQPAHEDASAAARASTPAQDGGDSESRLAFKGCSVEMGLPARSTMRSWRQALRDCGRAVRAL